MHLNPQEAALWAVIAIDLVLIGALLSPGTLTPEQRAPVLAGVITTLFVVAWRFRHRSGDE